MNPIFNGLFELPGLGFDVANGASVGPGVGHCNSGYDCSGALGLAPWAGLD